MIGVEEAKRILMEHVPVMAPCTVALPSATGFVMKDVTAPHDHPLFAMSAVDGYAFALGSANEWNVVGEIAAGEVHSTTLNLGECVRIFTGARMPEGADTVVMQEFVTRKGDRISHTDVRLEPGSNIRRKGEQVRQGQVILRAGERLNAAAKGLLSSVGVPDVQVAPPAEVCVIITGSEFVPGKEPLPGKIFGSNDVMLDALIPAAGAIARLHHVPDEMIALEEIIRQGLASSDMVVSTGGAAVGDHDLVRAAVERCGGRVLFHGVAQKPGKPMLFALFGDKPFFGLPGNPRAVLVLFWEYVLPFLRAMHGAKRPWLKTDVLPIAHALSAKGDRAEFRAAQVKGGRITLLADEGSHMLSSLIDADALAYVPANRRTWAAGDPMEVHYLP
ncbi:MAG: molybdopterin molybdotransferase MoeA [Flavobacteriales bacterium]|nr:molybdopterin molybdotransferase MoeA [Flavobacteriales bacterium]MBP6698937.1 molybdopterin molybdotransferase MoeA [Flavobacteriales bacterium]